MASLSDQLKNLSPEKRALLEKKLAQRAGPAAPTLAQRSASDPRVLSAAQHQLWFLDQLAPGGSAYNVPYAIRLSGDLNIPALQKALDTIVHRHEILRTMYLPFQGKVLPAVAKTWTLDLPVVDLRERPDPEADADALLYEESARPFVLTRDLKLRATLYRLAESRWILFHNSHHIAWDLQSRTIFYRELEYLYGGAPEPLPPPDLQYADYALWQHRFLQGATTEGLSNYWRDALGTKVAPLELPLDFPRPAQQKTEGKRLPLTLAPERLQAARSLGQARSATLYMVLLASFYAFLATVSGQREIRVGSPFDARTQPGTDGIIGMFINTLVLHARIDPAASFNDLITQVRGTVLKALTHQELPFERIVDAVHPPRDPSRMVLFQANFRLQGPPPPPLHLVGTTIESIRMVDNQTSKFDLALELPSQPEGRGYLEYCTSLFRLETSLAFAERYQTLLADLLQQPDSPLHDLPVWGK